MKIRHPILIRGAGRLMAALIRPWIATLQLKVDDRRSGSHPRDPRDQRFIYVFWHETMLAAMLFRSTPVHMLISQHADGEIIAQACGHLGIQVVRGSSRHGGAAALVELHRVSQFSHLAITPDGPRGPRRQLQPGVVRLASQVGLPILPVGIGFTRAWRAGSWDHFAVPVPFSGLRFVGGEPIEVPAKLTRDNTEFYRGLVEDRLREATEDAERWAADLPRENHSSATMTPASV